MATSSSSKAGTASQSAVADAIASETSGVSDSAPQARNVLTDSLPQPPGVQQRRARRAKSKERKGPFVKYVGNASHRVIRAADWGQLGFTPKDKDKGHQEFLWSPANDYLVESAQFTDEQLDYLLIDDVMPGGGHSFLEVDYDEDEDGNRVLVQVTDEDYETE